MAGSGRHATARWAGGSASFIDQLFWNIYYYHTIDQFYQVIINMKIFSSSLDFYIINISLDYFYKILVS